MYNGDLFIDVSTGKSQTLTGPEKCSQDLGEVLLTLLIPEKESRSYTAFSRDYGSELPYIQTPMQFSGVVGIPIISKKIAEAVSRLQQSQKRDPNSTPDERIDSITRLAVEQRGTNDFLFFLEVVLEGGTALQIQKMSPTHLDHLLIRTGFNDDRLSPRVR